jgi:hypothetical protein
VGEKKLIGGSCSHTRNVAQGEVNLLVIDAPSRDSVKFAEIKGDRSGCDVVVLDRQKKAAEEWLLFGRAPDGQSLTDFSQGKE